MRYTVAETKLARVSSLLRQNNEVMQNSPGRSTLL